MKNAAHTPSPEPALPQPVFDPIVDEFRRHSSASRPRRILLAEDDRRLRVTLRACLDLHGFDVLECGDGNEALARVHAGARVDLLLTDFEMPGMTGLQLAVELTVSRRGLPVILMSGSALASMLRQATEQRGWCFLPKPFMVPELVRTIDRAVQRPSMPNLLPRREGEQ